MAHNSTKKVRRTCSDISLSMVSQQTKNLKR